MAEQPGPKPGANPGPPAETAPDRGWLGRRVVVRSRVPGEIGPSGGPALTDVVGVVEGDSDREIAVRRRNGTLANIAKADILIIKAVPPPVAR